MKLQMILFDDEIKQCFLELLAQAAATRTGSYQNQSSHYQQVMYNQQQQGINQQAQSRVYLNQAPATLMGGAGGPGSIIQYSGQKPSGMQAWLPETAYERAVKLAHDLGWLKKDGT